MAGESVAVADARRALGAELAARRRAVGYSQAKCASLVGYSRSSIANVETGRQHLPREFWETVDAALDAGGILVEDSDEIEAMVRREHEETAHDASSLLVSLATDHGADSVGQSMLSPGGARSGAQVGSGLDVIAAAANAAREHAQQAAVTGIGPGTVEQITAEVVRLGRAYISAPPLPLFAAMHQTFGRIQAALDQKAYPAQARDLNFLAGALCGLMANASLDLGREEATEDLAQAAWTYGRVIDHGPLMGWARGTQALAAIWDHRYLDAVARAEDGLAHVPTGMGRVRLHAISARARAAHGDRAQARAAITAAGKARGDACQDELHDGVAGEFAFGDAKFFYYQALALASAEQPAEAEHAAAAAIRLYQAVPARARSYGCEALARIQLARTQLMNGKPEDAARTLSGVLALAPQMRIGSLSQHLDTCRQLLSIPAYRSSGAARQLDRQLAAFNAASAAQALPSRR